MQPQENSAVDPMPESSPFPSQCLCCACLTQCPKICPSCPNSHWEACPGWTRAAQRFLRDWAISGVIKGRWTKTMLKGKKYYQNPWNHVITWWNKKKHLLDQGRHQLHQPFPWGCELRALFQPVLLFPQVEYKSISSHLLQKADRRKRKEK